MASRSLLPKRWLEEYRVWLEAQGFKTRPGRGDFQVLQVQLKPPKWHALFEKLTRNPHYTVPDPLVRITRTFLDERNGNHHPAPWFQSCPDDELGDDWYIAHARKAGRNPPASRPTDSAEDRDPAPRQRPDTASSASQEAGGDPAPEGDDSPPF